MISNPVFSSSRAFYGWFVVAAAFAVTFVGFGSAYTFSAFVESLQKDFAASRGSVSLVFSLAGFLYFSLGIVSGPLADRWGSRRLYVYLLIEFQSASDRFMAVRIMIGVSRVSL